MRIIAGKFKGKKLNGFNFEGTRPTSDMIKQILFDCFGKLDGAVFLDLFAGTGAIGIEALSRNAQKVFFVDNCLKSIDLIKKNIYSLNLNNYSIIFKDYLSALKQFEKEKIKFDYIFLDPPYNSNYAEITLEFLLKNKILCDNGIIVWEHDNGKLNYCFDNFEIINQKKQGIKYLTFLKIKQKDSEYICK